MLIELLNEPRGREPPGDRGTWFLALSMTAVVFVVTDVVFDLWVTTAVSAAAAAAFVWFSYGLALTWRAQE